MTTKTDCTIVIPVFHENVQTVTQMYHELGLQGFKVIIVDDGSHMDFPEEMNVITYPANIGYGHAIKQGIKAADTPIILTMDGDAQHTVSDAQKLYAIYKMGEDIKMIVGQRWNINEKPLRWFGRKFLNFIASLISGHYQSDLNSGMRIFDAQLAKNYSPILCDTFSFTTSFTMAMVTDRHKIAYFPIDVQRRSYGKSNVKIVRDGLITLYYIVWVGLALRTRGIRKWLRNSITGRWTRKPVGVVGQMVSKALTKGSR